MIQIGSQVKTQGRTGFVTDISGEWFFVSLTGIDEPRGFRAGQIELV